MTFLKTKVWPVIAGLVVAVIIMAIFEWINRFIFPQQMGADMMSMAAMKAYTASLPWNAYILVFLGWAFGAFEGGCTTAWLAGEKKFRVTAALAALLLLFGLFTILVNGFPLPAAAIGLLILAIFPRLGQLALNTFEARKAAQAQQ